MSRDGDAIDALLSRLLAASGFAREAVGRESLRAALSMHGADPLASAARALADPSEYARIEAVFAPPETWLFRYPQSFELLRSFAASAGDRPIRALSLGSGGWCEPVSMAIALGAGATVHAIDRNPALLAPPTAFERFHQRGGIPMWAEAAFERRPDGSLSPRGDVLARIRARAGDVLAASEAFAAAGESFDVVAFRNVAIYQDAAVRACVLRAIAGVLAEGGVLLVGHAEVAATASETRFEADAQSGAFALRRATARRTGVPEAPLVEWRTAPRELIREATRDATRDAPPGAPAPTPAVRAPADPLTAARLEVTRSPTDAALRVRLARVLAELGMTGDAFEEAGRAIYLDRCNEEALLLASQLAEARGSHEVAERFRARALQVHLERMRAGDQA